ncbi:MAG: pantetheine-phosphate adenylyltransferase [Candidatus Omnitrophota bacterium]
MNRRAVYPGSFDPITYGHVDIIKRASSIFDEVIVAVAHNMDKKTLFSVQERVEMIRQAIKGINNVTVDDFNTLSVKYVKQHNIRILLRGLRMISDFEYEFQMALTNRKLDSSIETIFMMPNEIYSYVSSKLIKEAAALGAHLEEFVPPFVEKAILKKLKRKRG